MASQLAQDLREEMKTIGERVHTLEENQRILAALLRFLAEKPDEEKRRAVRVALGLEQQKVWGAQG